MVFRTEFVMKFCPVNEVLTAIMCLETQKYYQGSQDIDSYIDEFENLVEVSGYTDPIMIILKFLRSRTESLSWGLIALTMMTTTPGTAP